VLRTIGSRRREERRARERARLVQIYEGRRAWYHTVRPGDAVSSIASTYGTVPDSIRAWNRLPNDRIRIGETLLVKPWTRTAHPFPDGIVPDSVPPAGASSR
jgi:transposase-like protein